MCSLTSRIYEPEPGMNFTKPVDSRTLNLSEKVIFLWSHSTAFTIEK